MASMHKVKSNRFLWLLLGVTAGWLLYAAVDNISHSIWTDEGHTFGVVDASGLKQVVYNSFRQRPYPPLYFLIVHGFMKWRDDEVGLRITSLIFGFLSVYAVFLLGRALLDTRTGLIAALLYQLTPGLFGYFIEGNAYTMLVFFTTLSAFFLYRAVEGNEIRHWTGFALCSTAGLGAHLFGVFYAAAQTTAAAVLLRQRAGFPFRWSGLETIPTETRWKRLVLFSSIVFSVWIAWILFYYADGGVTRPLNLSKIMNIRTVFDLGKYIFGLYIPVYYQFFPALILLVVGGAALLREKHPGLLFIGIVWILPTTAIDLFGRCTLEFTAPRYGIGSFVLLCILAASAVRLFYGESGVRNRSVLLFLKPLVITLMGLYMLIGILAPRLQIPDLYSSQDWKGAVTFLKNEIDPRDAVLVYSFGMKYAFEFYYRGRDDLPEATYVPYGEEPVEALTDYVNGNPPDRRIWFVWGTHRGTAYLFYRAVYPRLPTPEEISEDHFEMILKALPDLKHPVKAEKHVFKRVLVVSVIPVE